MSTMQSLGTFVADVSLTAVGLPVGGPPRDGELNNHNDRTTNWNEDEGNDDNNGDASSDEQTYGVSTSPYICFL